jgi:catechol 2,3-dioxygenase-like lactoylglutathione lyase family enzyme
MTPHGILETVLYADDLDAAESFYARVLGLTVINRDPGRHVFFRCGGAMLLIFDPHAAATHSSVIDNTTIPRHGATGPGHIAFTIDDADIDPWLEHLDRHHIDLEARIHWPNGGQSLYVRDPAGNSIELATQRLWA